MAHKADQQLIEKIQEQLNGLDKKLDILIGRIMATPVLMSNTSHSPQPKPVEKKMFQAICADCHKECSLPFKPNNDRPVYCQECFAVRKKENRFKPERKPSPMQVSLAPVIKEEPPVVVKGKKKAAPAKKAASKKKIAAKKKK